MTARRFIDLRDKAVRQAIVDNNLTLFDDFVHKHGYYPKYLEQQTHVYKRRFIAHVALTCTGLPDWIKAYAKRILGRKVV